MSSAVTLVTGLIETSFGDCCRREPVTTTSCRVVSAAVPAPVADVTVCDIAIGTDADAAAAASAAWMANCNLRLFPICCSLTLRLEFEWPDWRLPRNDCALHPGCHQLWSNYNMLN